MNITEALKTAGFKPEANTDGEWKPYIGTYKCVWKTLRPEVQQKDGAEFVQAEWSIVEALAGDPKRESKYADFRRRYYFSWENPTEDELDNIKGLMNDIFTATGKDVNMSSKEAFSAAAVEIAGAEAYIRGWGWTPERDTKGNSLPEDQRKTIQQFVIQRKATAEKKRTGASLPF